MDYSILHRKESLVLATIELIDKKGLHAVSTREIARSQGITEGAIFKHFATKNELLLGVLHFFVKYDKDISQTTVIKNMQTHEAIIFAVNSLMIYYENYPSITSVLLAMEIMRYDPDLKAEVDKVIHSRVKFLRKQLTEGKYLGHVRGDVDEKIVTDMIIGSIKEICLRWRMEGYAFSLREQVLSAVSTILEGTKP